jgi:hypothetical protein
MTFLYLYVLVAAGFFGAVINHDIDFHDSEITNGWVGVWRIVGPILAFAICLLWPIIIFLPDRED